MINMEKIDIDIEMTRIQNFVEKYLTHSQQGIFYAFCYGVLIGMIDNRDKLGIVSYEQLVMMLEKEVVRVKKLKI
jgi:hypothetical protein